MRKDLSGTRYNRWIVLNFVRWEKKNPYWKCQCDCGTIREVSANDLNSGRSKSCGCLRKEKLIERHNNKKMASPIRIELIQTVLETVTLPLS